MSAAELRARVEACNAALAASADAEARSRECYAAKDHSVVRLKQTMRPTSGMPMSRSAAMRY